MGRRLFKSVDGSYLLNSAHIVGLVQGKSLSLFESGLVRNVAHIMTVISMLVLISSKKDCA